MYLQVKIPVAVHVRGTECKAVMEQGWVNDSTVLRMFHQLCKVAEMSVTAPHAVTGTVLIQHKDLARTKPALQKEEQQQKKIIIFPAPEFTFLQALLGIVSRKCVSVFYHFFLFSISSMFLIVFKTANAINFGTGLGH